MVTNDARNLIHEKWSVGWDQRANASAGPRVEGAHIGGPARLNCRLSHPASAALIPVFGDRDKHRASILDLPSCPTGHDFLPGCTGSFVERCFLCYV